MIRKNFLLHIFTQLKCKSLCCIGCSFTRLVSRMSLQTHHKMIEITFFLLWTEQKKRKNHLKRVLKWEKQRQSLFRIFHSWISEIYFSTFKNHFNHFSFHHIILNIFTDYEQKCEIVRGAKCEVEESNIAQDREAWKASMSVKMNYELSTFIHRIKLSIV